MTRPTATAPMVLLLLIVANGSSALPLPRCAFAAGGPPKKFPKRGARSAPRTAGVFDETTVARGSCLGGGGRLSRGRGATGGRFAVASRASPSALRAAPDGEKGGGVVDAVEEEEATKSVRSDETLEMVKTRVAPDDSDSDDSSAATASGEGETKKSPLYLFFDAVEMVFSYSFQFWGNAVFLGIFLNLCGIGYYFDSNKGLQFDSLANIREKRQFEDAARIMAKEAESRQQQQRQDIETRPKSLLPE